MTDTNQADIIQALIDRADLTEEDVAAVREAVQQLLNAQSATDEALTRIENAVRGGAAGDDDAVPHRWATLATEEDWATLVDWVDDLVLTYELGDKLKPCWPAHAGVVEELAALYAAWRQAAKKSTADDDAYAFWHDRVLVPTLERVGGGFYPMRSCRTQHDKPPAATLTNRATMPSPTLPTGALTKAGR